MKNRKHKVGFTLVELMVSMLASSIIALTAGTMLFYGYVGWTKNNSSIEVQRDGTLVLDMLSRAIRAAAETNITMEVDGFRVATTDGEVAFLSSGNSLTYHYVANGLPEQMILVDERLALFSPSLVTNKGMRVDLRIQDAGQASQARAFFGFRN